MSERRVKVMFVPQWYPSRRNQNGVSGTFCREHVHAATLYDDVSVLVFNSRPERRPSLKIERYDDQGIPTWYASYGHSPIPHTTPPLFWIHMWRAIRKVVKEWGKPDVIHTQDAYAYPVIRCSRQLGVPYVVSQQWTGFIKREIPTRRIGQFRWAFSHAHRVLPVNQYAIQDYNYYGITASVRWLPNTIDTTVFRPEPLAAREPWLLHASGFTAQKRFPDILRAFAIVQKHNPEAVLQVAGDGHARREMEALGREMLPVESVAFHGLLSKPELAELMRRSRGFIFPSEFETFGCVLMEAMACGCPVLTTRVGGIPAVVRDGEGLFVEVGDIEAIAEGMLRLLDGTHGIDTEWVSRDSQDRFSREAVGRVLHEEHLSAAQAAMSPAGRS